MDIKAQLDLTSKHGKEMYIIGLQYAINMFEIAGEEVLPRLKERITEVQKEIEEIK